MIQTINKTVGEIVADDYRAAAIFESFGIDFCCKGNRTIDEACASKKIDPEMVNEKLNSIGETPQGGAPDFASWPLDLLADYIEKKHHRYITEATPMLQQFLEKLCKVHGQRHPELFDIASEFNSSAGELAMHMKKEELIFFPYVRRLMAAVAGKSSFEKAAFGTIENPLKVLLAEHDTEGERFRKISELTNGYTAPDDGCTTYRVAFQMLSDFEKDLHLHIHLENNILFPKTEALEKQLFS